MPLQKTYTCKGVASGPARLAWILVDPCGAIWPASHPHWYWMSLTLAQKTAPIASVGANGRRKRPPPSNHATPAPTDEQASQGGYDIPTLERAAPTPTGWGLEVLAAE